MSVNKFEWNDESVIDFIRKEGKCFIENDGKVMLKVLSTLEHGADVEVLNTESQTLREAYAVWGNLNQLKDGEAKLQVMDCEFFESWKATIEKNTKK